MEEGEEVTERAQAAFASTAAFDVSLSLSPLDGDDED